jgi:pimeloyl-ACP methyl ester carboxylesterase
MNDFFVRWAVRDPQLSDDVLRGGVAVEVMQDALRELRRLHPIASLRRVDVPVWLVNGTLDHFRIEERRYLAAAPDARLIHVPGATHMVSVARPAAFTRILLEAVAEVESPTRSPRVETPAASDSLQKDNRGEHHD